MTEKTKAPSDSALYARARLAQQKAIRQRRRRLSAAAKAAGLADAQKTALAATQAPWPSPADPGDPVAQERTQPTTLAGTHRSPTQQSGDDAETRAMRFLQDQGVVILQRNLHCRAGEIDLVCQHDDTLAFVEVRQRSTTEFGGAAASVNRHKQQRLIRAAHYFLPKLTRLHFNGRSPACRFDVIALEPDGLHWIRDAFRVDR